MSSAARHVSASVISPHELAGEIWRVTIQKKGNVDQVVLADAAGQRRWKGLQPAFKDRAVVDQTDHGPRLAMRLPEGVAVFTIDPAGFKQLDAVITFQPPKELLPATVASDLIAMGLMVIGLCMVFVVLIILGAGRAYGWLHETAFIVPLVVVGSVGLLLAIAGFVIFRLTKVYD